MAVIGDGERGYVWDDEKREVIVFGTPKSLKILERKMDGLAQQAARHFVDKFDPTDVVGMRKNLEPMAEAIRRSAKKKVTSR